MTKVYPEPKFEIGNTVRTPKGLRVIKAYHGYRLIDDLWVPTYSCAALKKDGTIDKRRSSKLFADTFIETEILKQEEKK